MTMPGARTGRWGWITLAVIVAAIAWTHASVLSAGLRSDDYFTIRLWTTAEIRSVLTGSWDPFGFQDPYHRPLTALYQSLWYPLFGYDGRAMHAVSLVELAIVAAGLAAFVSRELRRPAAGALAAVVLIVHPMLPDSTSAWIFNQMSLLADFTIVGALLAWQRARTGNGRAWWLVWACAIVSVYVKEDGAMIVPAVLTLQWWRARQLGDVPSPSRRTVLTGLAVLAVLVAVRVVVYPAAAPWPPSIAHIGYYTRNLLSGPWHVLMRLPGDTAAGVPGNVSVVLTLLAGLALAWRRRLRTGSATLLGSGAILMAWLGAPLLFAAGPTRSHLITFAAAIMICAAMLIVYDACRGRLMQRLVIAGMIATLLSLSLAARSINAQYAPCTTASLHEDDLVSTSPAVAPELRAWLRAKRAACAAGTTGSEPFSTDIHK